MFKIKNLPIPYLWAILGGPALAVINVFKEFLYIWYWNELDSYNFQRKFVVDLINFTLWGFLTPVIYHFFKKYKLSKGEPWQDQMKAVLVGFAFAFFHEIVSNIIYYLPTHLTGSNPFTRKYLTHILGMFPSALIARLIEYWIIYAVFAALDFQRQFRNKQMELVQLENQLASAQLSALRLQLHPHFLFNTLNTISSLMEIDIKGSQKIVSQLGHLLRRLLEENKENQYKLSEELEFVRNYLDIEQVRFNDRLVIQYQIDEETLNAQVPSLIFQPLIENALKHGFAQKVEEAVIQVISRRKGDQIELIVRDDGRGSSLDQATLLASGIGLKNVRDRLALIYQDQFKLKVNTQPGKGFEVRITIPYHKHPS